MTNQEKYQTAQTLNEITVLLEEARSKYVKELPQTARVKYASTYSNIIEAESSLININYDLFEKEVK